MKTFTRIRNTITANIESFVGQIENHEAIAAATTQKLEQAAVRLRVHRKRAERRALDARARLAKLTETAQTWHDRAARLKDDREKGIECVRRFRAAKRALAAVTGEIDEEQRLIEQLVSDERALSAQVDALKRRRASLSSREARSEAVGDFDADDGVLEIFERWEARIETKEAVIEADKITSDPLAEAFEAEEDRADLERAFDDILRDGVRS